MKKRHIALIVAVAIVAFGIIPICAQGDLLRSSEEPDLIVTEIKAYHNNTDCPAWFNLSNEIDVTVTNNGSTPAKASNVSLYIDDEFFGRLPVSSLAAGANETVTFENWKPTGDDCLKTIDNICYFHWSFRDFKNNITAVADCDNEVAETNETNNERSVLDPKKTRACYNGYMADEPLENVAHGMLHGAVLFTTGDGTYGGLYSPGDTRTTNFDITIPDNANVELAKLNVYYTWTSPDHACPEMEVHITNATGTYVVPLEKAYNDIKCTCPGTSWIQTWGNYVFDVTDYITGSGTCTVTVENIGSTGHSFCIAAPGIALVYEDQNASLIEYWINTGADVLMGGRRYTYTVNLAWWECINNATFQASNQNLQVVNATLGVVSPFGDDAPNDILFFNGAELGRGVYHGFGGTYQKTIDGLTMQVGSTNAQVGVNVSNVTALYQKGNSNVAGQSDDGDNMVAVNAFLVVEYASKPSTPFLIDGWVNCTDGDPVNDPSVTVTNLNTSEVFIAETNVSSNYYHVITSSLNVSAGNVLHFNVSNTEFDHPVTQGEMDAGGFEQNATIECGGPWLCGDVTGDGKVTMADGRRIYMHIIYGVELNCDPCEADVTGDGKITMADGRRIYMHKI